MTTEAEKKINQISADDWGIEFAKLVAEAIGND